MEVAQPFSDLGLRWSLKQNMKTSIPSLLVSLSMANTEFLSEIQLQWELLASKHLYSQLECANGANLHGINLAWEKEKKSSKQREREMKNKEGNKNLNTE